MNFKFKKRQREKHLYDKTRKHINVLFFLHFFFHDYFCLDNITLEIEVHNAGVYVVNKVEKLSRHSNKTTSFKWERLYSVSIQKLPFSEFGQAVILPYLKDNLF